MSKPASPVHAAIRRSVLALGILCAGFAHAGGADVTYSVASNGFGAWSIDGVDNPPLTLARGKTYAFALQDVSVAHPFNINTITPPVHSTSTTTGSATTGRADRR